MPRTGTAYAMSEPLPGLPGYKAQKTYARWQVWSGSTTDEARFKPMPKGQAARIWHKARAFDRATHKPGQHGGAVGRTALLVLHALLFEFMNYRSGRLDPSYDGIAKRAGVCRRSVAAALVRLRELGMLHWIRRAVLTNDVLKGFLLVQKTNAYAVLPPSQWRGYRELSFAIHPTEWGAVPSLPSMIEQAQVALRDGDNVRAIVPRLNADPGDKTACALASLFKTILARKR